MIKSTDFAPLPESEWTDEEIANGGRVVCKRNDDDPKRLDFFIQLRAISYTVSFPSDEEKSP